MTERTVPRIRPLSMLLAPRSMRTALLVMLLPFIALPLLLGFLGYSRIQQGLMDTAEYFLANEADTVGKSLNQLRDGALLSFDAVTQNASAVQAAQAYLANPSPAGAQNVLAVARALNPGAPNIVDLAIVDYKTNIILASTQPEWVSKTYPLSIAAWNFPYSQALFNKEPFSADQLSVMVAQPFRSGGDRLDLVLVGRFDPGVLASVMSTGEHLPPRRYFYLASIRDQWMATFAAAGTLRMADLPADAGNRMAGTREEARTYTNAADVAVVGYLRNTIDSATIIVAEMPAEEVMAPMATIHGFILAVGASILLAGVLATAVGWFYLARPTTQLADAVSRIVSGKSDEPIPMFGTREFSSLASSVNKLTSEIRNVTQVMGPGGQATTRKVMVLADLTQSLTGVASLEETLRLVVTLVAERLGYQFAAVYLVDEAGQFATIRAATGAAGEKLKEQGHRFPLGSYSIIGSVAQSGRTHAAANVAEDPMYIRNDLLPDTRSEAALPIRVGKRTIGALDVHAVAQNAFSPEDLELLQSVADQAGASIQNVQVLESANLNMQVSTQLFRTSRLIAVATKPEEIYRAALEGLKGSSYIVTILTAGNSRLDISGFFDPVNPLAETPPVEAVFDPPDALGRLLPSAAPLVLKVWSELSRIPVSLRQYLENIGARMVGFLPLRQGERILGAVMLSARDEASLNLNRVRPYLPIAEQILIALERLELIQTTQDRLNELATLNRISQSISQAQDLQTLYETVHEQVRTAIGDVDILFALYDPQRDLVTYPYAFLAGEPANLEPAPLSDSLYSIVVRTSQPLLLTENLEQRAASLGVRTSIPAPKSWLGVPLVTANQVVGVLTLQDPEKEQGFTDNDMRLLSTVAAQVASTIRTSVLLAESERKAVQLQTAAEIARETIGLLDLDRLLTHSVNLIRERFGFYHSSVFLLDDEHKFAVLRESTGEAGRQMKARAHKLGIGSQSIVGWVTQNARPRIADDVTADPMHKPNPLLPATRAEMGIPLRIGDSVIGALDVQSTTPYAFAPDDVAILQVIADQIAIAVENARLFSQTREYLTRHRSLYQVTASAASSTTVENALFSAAQGLRNTMVGARVAILLLNPEKDTLIMRAHAGFTSREVEKLQIPVGQGVPGWVAVNKQPSLVANTATDARYLMIDSDVQSELCVPLLHRDELLGVLDMHHQRLAAFSEDDVQLLGTVTSSLAAIMSSTLLFEQVTQERERLRHLYEEAIGMAGPPAGSMDTLLRTALERVRTVSGADCVAIAFPSGQDEARIDMCTCEPHFHHLAGTVSHYGQDVIGEALALSQVVNYSVSVDTSPLARSLSQAGVRTALALPLQWAGRTIGGLLISRMSSDRAFSNEETQLASLLALQVAATIESARLFDQTRRQAEREHLLFEITSRIRRSVDMKGILSTTANELSKALGAQRATIKIGGIPSTPGGVTDSETDAKGR